MNAGQRDKSLERLLRQSAPQPDAAGAGEACLDAETLGAWMDGGLRGLALDAAVAHAAGCARCQGLMSAMVRIDAAAPEGPETIDERPARGWLVWLAPLTAAAAAVAIWVAVPTNRYAPVPVAPVGVDARLEDASPAREQVPSVPQPSSEALGAAASVEQSAPVPGAGETGNVAARDQRAGGQAEERSDRALFEADSTADGAASTEARRDTPGSTPPAAVAKSARAALPPAASTPAGAAVPAAPVAVARSAAPEAMAGRVEAVARLEVVSPDPQVRWRVVGANIEQSADGGARWEAVATGVATEVVAGAAPSPTVCWLVGRGGVVLRSTDGRSWRRLVFPEGVDLSAVRARDARSASVTARDGRPFSTTDGGETWAPRPLQEF